MPGCAGPSTAQSLLWGADVERNSRRECVPVQTDPLATIKIGPLNCSFIPTGMCWCGCSAETSIGSFFIAGHDKIAESAVIKIEYGSVPQNLG